MSQQPKTFALGLGLTNECNLTCSFCYRDPNRVDRLTLDQVQQVMNSLPVHSVNLGTGENGMHPDFLPILDFLRSQSIKLTITSNGHSIAVLDDEQLCAFHDVEFSLDYPTEEEQDRQRGSGNWRLIHEQAARCGPLSTLEALGEDIGKWRRSLRREWCLSFVRRATFAMFVMEAAREEECSRAELSSLISIVLLLAVIVRNSRSGWRLPVICQSLVALARPWLSHGISRKKAQKAQKREIRYGRNFCAFLWLMSLDRNARECYENASRRQHGAAHRSGDF